MFDKDISAFRPIAIGVVSKNKKRKSVEIVATPIERLPYVDGELVGNVETQEYSASGKDGAESAGVAFVSNDLPCTWLPESNRLTAPDVRRGERVIIYQYSENDKYYWRDIGDNHLRRLETVVYAINANPSLEQDGTDPSNLYFLEISSHSKTITLQTSKKNGEYCTYALQFDLANGKVVLEDDLKNHFVFNSKDTLMQFKNRLNTRFELNKQDITAYAPKNITMTAENNVDVKAKKVTINGGGSVMTLQASGTTLRTPKFTGVS